MRKLASVLVILAIVFQSGCATLLKGRHEEIMVSSDPAGANLSINGKNEGTTPYAGTVPSDKNLDIELTKAGYQPLKIADNTSFRWGYEFWSFIWYVIPVGVDMADGAAWGHDQTMVAAHLQPIRPVASNSSQPPAGSGAPAATAESTTPPAPLQPAEAASSAAKSNPAAAQTPLETNRDASAGNAATVK